MSIVAFLSYFFQEKTKEIKDLQHVVLIRKTG